MRPGKPAFLALALIALTATPVLAATTHDIQVGESGNTFSPSSISIPAGDSIRFINSGAGFHSAQSDDNGTTFSSGPAASGPWSYTTPALSASIGFHCVVHGAAGSGMFGTITVTTPVTLQSFDVN